MDLQSKVHQKDGEKDDSNKVSYLRVVEIRFERLAIEEYKALERKANENKNSIEARIFNAAEKVLDDLEIALHNNRTIKIGRPISVN